MSQPPLLSANDIKEALSFAFVSLIAARAGYTCASPMQHDRDSVDAQIRAGGTMRPALDIQLKATSSPKFTEGELSFPLKKKNYDDLRALRAIPILLVVFELPQTEDQWLTWSDEQHIIKKRAWWISLKGRNHIETESTTVRLSPSNRFTVDALKDIMSKLSAGDSL